MKKIISAALCLLLLLFCALPAWAANDVPEAVMDAANSVVRILSEYYNGSATGSGFVIKNEPGETLIVTNNHVVEGHPQSISVWIDEDWLVSAEIVFSTPEQDLCVLCVTDHIEMEALQLAEESPRKGEAIYAVGFPAVADIFSDTAAHTSEAATITDGIISAIRTLTLVDGGDQVKLLQINADINSGNSGGPLFNAQGQVIGVNTYGITNAQGVFGAIDISELRMLLDENYIYLSDVAAADVQSLPENVLAPVPAGVLIGISVALIALTLLVAFALIKSQRSKARAAAVTLRSYVAAHPNGLDIHEAVAMLLPIAIQLRDMHNNGTLYLQVSPDTIVITPKGVALKGAPGIEAERFSGGFAAPEIYEGSGIGAASDIYSFCAVLFFAVTGKVPANSLKQEDLQSDFALYESISPESLKVVQQGMAFQSHNRTASMQQIIYQISAFNCAPFQPPKEPKINVKPVSALVSVVICAILGAAFAVNPVIVQAINYNRAIDLMEAGQYSSALAVFQAVEAYKDSADRIQACRTANNDGKYQQAKQLMDIKAYDEAIQLFSEIRGYLDADTLRKECGEAKLFEAARSNFEGKWIWNHPSWINPYDQYYEFDFETMTITFYFKSSTTEFTRIFDFEIDSANVLTASGFRNEGTVSIRYLGAEIFLDYPYGSKAPSSDEDHLYLHRIGNAE